VNNPNFADVQISVEKQVIYAHSQILQVRCPSILNPKDPKKKPKKKKNTLLVDLEGISNQILLEALYFVYTGSIDLSSLNETQVLNLLAGANLLGLERLSWLCTKWIREKTNTDNMFRIIKGNFLFFSFLSFLHFFI
jgi:hypothetical protein